MSFVNMKMSQAERDEQSATYQTPSDQKDIYPYGLEVSLDDDALEKLGLLSDLPDVGEVITFTAKAVVTNVSQNATGQPGDEADKEQSVRMQITDMDVITAPGQGNQPGTELYNR